MSQTSNLLNYIIKRYLYNNEATWDDITERVSKLFPPIKPFMSNMEFIPGGRNLANINTDHVLVPNCVVVDIEDNLTDIFNTLTRLVELTRRGAGIGMNFGKLRPANSVAKHFVAKSCGPVGFLNMYSVVLKTIQQMSRHGAFIGILPITHPDVLAFITVKQDLTKINNFNLSILVDDEFINNVREHPNELAHADYTIVHDDGTTEKITDYNYITYDDNFVVKDVSKIDITYGELFDEMVKCMHRTGEPGLLFKDNINKDNILKPLFGDITACNPCVIKGTTILTKEFGNVFIENHVGEVLNVWTGNGYSPAIIKMTGFNQVVYRVVLSDGREITTTGYHKYVLPNMEQKPLKDLCVGQHLYNPKIPSTIYYHDDLPLTISQITKLDELADVVYCVTTLDSTHRCCFNNIITGNCGEIPMYPNECCNLGSINLSKFAKCLDYNPLPSDDSGFDIDQFIKENVNIHRLKQCVHNAVIFLDKVINNINTEDVLIDRFVRKTRRIGLGVMGIHDMLISLKIPYDRQEGRAIVKTVLGIIKEEAYKTSEQLVDGMIIEHDGHTITISPRGSIYDRFSKRLGVKQHDGYLSESSKHRANVSLMTIAPNGSTSMIANVSSGVEPYYSLGYYRLVDNGTKQTGLIINKQLEQWIHNHIDESIRDDVIKDIITNGISTVDIIPDYIKNVFKTAQDISPKDHILMLCAAQSQVDNAISKTINLPEDTSEHDIGKCIITAWKHGAKGMTVYRDNCRQNVITSSLSRDSCESGLCDL